MSKEEIVKLEEIIERTKFLYKEPLDEEEEEKLEEEELEEDLEKLEKLTRNALVEAIIDGTKFSYKEELDEEEYYGWYERVLSVHKTLGILHSIANLGLSATVALWHTYGEEYFEDKYLQNDSIVQNKENERDIPKILATINAKIIQNNNIIAEKFGICIYTICYLIYSDYDNLVEQRQIATYIYDYEETVLAGIVGLIEYNGVSPCSFEFEEKMMETYLDCIKQTALGKELLEFIDKGYQ